jgi:sulfate adenylyltransferase subunit 1 (EFTu-like GTPase family)
MKRNIFISLIVAIILIIFSTSIIASGTIDVKDYIKDKFPSIFSFYLSSLEELDQYEKEFIDLLEKLPEDQQENYAKEVYKNGFSLELLENVKEGKTIKVPASRPVFPSLPKPKEKPIENLPTLIKIIKPSVVIVFAYDDKGEFLTLLR